jgi:site-specific DNA-methyltransferase (adenine-specific)
VIPYARNPRQIPQSAIDKVAASIQEFGFRQPLVVDAKGVIVVGHVRLQAAQKLGMTEVPVHIADGLTKSQVKAYRLMDNRCNQETAWDDELLGLELLDLEDLEFDLELTGFDQDELTALLAEKTVGLTDEDEAPAVQDFALIEPGDLWILGNHRLLCGDATSLDAVERLMDGQKADMVFTDPPYNVDYEGYTEEKLKIEGDKMTPVQFQEFLLGVFSSYLWALKPGGSLYLLSSVVLATGVPGGSRALGLRSPLPDHLGEEHLRLGFRPLQVSARADFLLSPQRTERCLVRG